jgi:Tfp pilus assembly protein PilP
MYDNMDKYINGEGVDRDKKKTASRFLEVANYDMETLKLRAIVKDGNYYKTIATRGDGNIYHMKSGAMLGKTPADVVEYLKNPLNEEILMEMTKTVEQYWNS